MEVSQKIKELVDYKLQNGNNNIQLNINEYGYIHSKNTIENIKNYINNKMLTNYSSLNSENQKNILKNLQKYINIEKINESNIILSNSGDINISSILKCYTYDNSNIYIYILIYT